jgi:hypothetical protein
MVLLPLQKKVSNITKHFKRNYFIRYFNPDLKKDKESSNQSLCCCGCGNDVTQSRLICKISTKLVYDHSCYADHYGDQGTCKTCANLTGIVLCCKSYIYLLYLCIVIARLLGPCSAKRNTNAKREKSRSSTVTKQVTSIKTMKRIALLSTKLMISKLPKMISISTDEPVTTTNNQSSTIFNYKSAKK